MVSSLQDVGHGPTKGRLEVDGDRLMSTQVADFASVKDRYIAHQLDDVAEQVGQGLFDLSRGVEDFMDLADV